MILPPMRTRNPIVDVALVVAGVLLAKPLSKLVKKLTRKEEAPIQPVTIKMFDMEELDEFDRRISGLLAKHQKFADSPPDKTE